MKLTIHPHPVLRPRLSGLFFHSLICTQTNAYHNENHWFLVCIFEIKYRFIKVMCLLVQLTTYPTEPPFSQEISQPFSQMVSHSVTPLFSLTLNAIKSCSLAHSLTHPFTHTLVHSHTHLLTHSITSACSLLKKIYKLRSM